MLTDKKIENIVGETIENMFAKIKVKFKEALPEALYSDESITTNACNIAFTIGNDTRKYKMYLYKIGDVTRFLICKMCIDGITICRKEKGNYITDPNNTSTSISAAGIEISFDNYRNTYFYIRVIEGKNKSFIITLMKEGEVGYGIADKCIKIFKVTEVGSNTEKYISAVSYFYRYDGYQTEINKYAFTDKISDPKKNGESISSSSPEPSELDTNAELYSCDQEGLNITRSFLASSVVSLMAFDKTLKIAAFAKDIYSFGDTIGQNYGVLVAIIDGIKRTFYKFDRKLLIEI